MLHYNWWVPKVHTRSRKPAIVRLFTDVEYVTPWAYLLVPALMFLFVATSSAMQSLPALMATAVVTAGWIVATRARFALAVNACSRRSSHLTVVPQSETRKAA